MAEAWARHLFPRDWQIASAGLLTYPITESTRRVMREVGLDLVGQESKTLDRFDLQQFDLIVTLSEEAGRFLPTLERPERHLHRPLTDPMGVEGNPEERLLAFRTARDEIRDLVTGIGSGEVSSPAEKGD
jgi:arsenate reductase